MTMQNKALVPAADGITSRPSAASVELLKISMDDRQLPRNYELETVRQALELREQRLVPLIEAEPSLDKSASRELVNALADIGMKIAPAMDDDACRKWRVAMLKALSNLPGRVAVAAAQQALGVPMRFLNEVETVVRDKAEAIQRVQRGSRTRLQRLLNELEQAAANAAAPKLEHKTAEPFTREEIRGWNADLRKMALGQGWVTQEEIDDADREEAIPCGSGAGGGGATDTAG